MQALLDGNARELALVHGNLLSAARGKELASLLITSSHTGEGKTTSAISLAYAMARFAHMRVLLIDGNASAPVLHRYFGVHPSPGLVDAVFDEAPVAELVQPTGLADVAVLPFGDDARGSLALYRSNALKQVFEGLRPRFDLLIVDGPPLLESSDATLVSRHLDGVLLVIACEQTTWEVAQHVQRKLTSVGATLLGAILNRRKYYVPAGLYGQ
jgi:capsular exopolysaccharide synthesis family protein